MSDGSVMQTNKAGKREESFGGLGEELTDRDISTSGHKGPGDHCRSLNFY